MVGASNPAPPLAGYAAQSRKARCKKQPERRALRPQARFGAQPPQAALGAEIGCSSVLTPPNRRRMVGARNPAPPLAGYAAPYAAETSRYVPPLYTYPTKFMHNLCHIVM